MADFKSVTEYKEKLAKLVESNEAACAELEKKLVRANDDAATYKDQMEAAKGSADTGAYLAAKHNLSDAEDCIQILTERIAAMRTASLVSDDDAVETAEAIKAEYEAYKKTAEAKLAQHAEAMYDIAEELRTATRNANSALASVYNDMTRRTAKGGQQTVYDGRVVLWGQMAACFDRYTSATGKRKEKLVVG